MRFARSFDSVGYRMDTLLILSNQPSLTIDKKAGLAIANPAFFFECHYFSAMDKSFMKQKSKGGVI